MEIRNVENEVKNNYPKKEDISNKTLKKSIPQKWKILGISTLAVMLIGGFGIKVMLDRAYEMVQITSGGIDEQTVPLFNCKFEDYIGHQSGKKVKALISQIISTNGASYYAGLPERIVSFNGKTDAQDISEERKAIVEDKMYNVELSYNAETNLIYSITS